LVKGVVSIELGKDAKDYIKIMDKDLSFKRSTCRIRAKGNRIEITVEAADNVAMFASLNSALKQLRIISSVDSKLKRLK
jgi:tRNA threonylcarbamoyladenosine modification (KEOPS) complex  Pcc1 subunit